MSIYLFHTLSLLLITCFICGCVCSDVIATSDVTKSIEMFKIEEEIKNILKVDGENNGDDDGKITPSAFYSPFIVAADDVMIALTGVNRTDSGGDNKHVDILTKYITTKERDVWSAKVTNNEGWKTQFAFKESNQQKNVVKGLVAAAKGEKIYLLLLNETEGDGSDPNCGIKLVEGTVSGGEKETGMTIKWVTKSIDSLDSEDAKNCLTKLQLSNYLSASYVYLEKNKTIVFVVHVKSNGNKSKYVFVSLDDNTESNAKLSYVGKTEESCPSSFFPWGENKIIMISTNCKNSENKLFVNESSNMGETWTESVEPLARLLDFMQDKNDFTTTKINGSNILLFTQQKPKTTSGNSGQTKFDVHVWFTDGNRVSTAGRIATDDNITSSQLLHTKGELLALYQNIKEGTPENITLTRMENQLNEITTVITAWKNTDNIVTELFKNTFASSESLKATDGLVGFLSNNGTSNKNWADEYYYVNATVTNGEKVNGGFTFKEKGAGARWPVGKSTEDQPYNFTDPGFTLVANVTIDGDATINNDNSVLGVVYKENNSVEKTVGLWCTAKCEWKLTGNGGSHETIANGQQCNKGSAYLVGVILNKSELFVHINGERLVGNNKINIGNAHNITHFYLGVNDQTPPKNNNDETHVTVTNVLLYNRPLAEDVIKQLKISKSENPKPNVDTKSQNGSNDVNTQEDKETPRAGTDDKKGTSDQSNDTADNNNNNEERLPSTPEDSTVREGVDCVLLFLLLLLLNACM